MKAARWYNEGMVTKRGKAIKDADAKTVKFTPGEAALKALSFRTVKEAEMQRQRESQRIASDPWTERRKLLLEEFKIKYHRYGGDSQEVKNVEAKMDKFNEEWFAAEKSGIPTGVEKFTRKGNRQSLSGKEPKAKQRLRRAFP